MTREQHEQEEDMLDVSASPELLRVAEEVHTSGKARVLQRNGERLAVIVPLPAQPAGRHKPRQLTPQDVADFFGAAGGWADVNLEQFLADVYASREQPGDRPPVEF